MVTTSNLRAYNVLWDISHPLVFVNCCHTARVGRATPFDLVSAFVQDSQAAGVIGSQVTLFEPLACTFAERLLEELIVGGKTVVTRYEPCG